MDICSGCDGCLIAVNFLAARLRIWMVWGRVLVAVKFLTAWLRTPAVCNAILRIIKVDWVSACRVRPWEGSLATDLVRVTWASNVRVCWAAFMRSFDAWVREETINSLDIERRNMPVRIVWAIISTDWDVSLVYISVLMASAWIPRLWETSLGIVAKGIATS